jgi:mercuric ion transport protein
MERSEIRDKIRGAAGLSAAVGYLDIGLIPALAIFLAITGYALWRRKNPE